MAVSRPLRTDPQAALTSFEAGHYGEFLIEQGERVPGWAWLNAVARGSLLLVSSLAMATSVTAGDPHLLPAWRRARKAIAKAVLEHAERTGASLAEVQHEVLHGLELELAATAGIFERGPIETTCLVLDALGAHQPSI